MPLKGKVAFVTGSGRNMGKAIALDLAHQGVAVAVHARENAAEVEAVVAEAKALGVKAVGVVGDLGSRKEVLHLVCAAENTLGPVDILVNSVAMRPSRAFLEMSEADLARVMGVNLYAPVWAAQAVLPGMMERKWGRIINFSGRASFEGAPRRAHVSISKTGILGLTRGLALEFGPYGITVNTIVPGTFDTERPAAWAMGEGRTIAAVRPTAAETTHREAVGRVGRVEEISSLVTYLCTDEAGFLTGQSLHVNGGAYVT